MGSLASPALFVGEELDRYGFGHGHPFGRDRQQAFREAARSRGLEARMRTMPPVMAERATIERFHTEAYVDRVAQLSQRGEGYLDLGDTPAFPGVLEAAAYVVGSAVAAAEGILREDWPRAMVPIAGLHHARRDRAEGFCVFNDCGVVIEVLKGVLGLKRVAYVDIDAHHGDGVYYGFEADPGVWTADVHQDGQTLFPGTGAANEQGTGEAMGTKLNIPLAPGSDDDAFHHVWPSVERHLDQAQPELVILQCGADSLAGDPLANLGYTWRVHAHVTERLRRVADRHAGGRLLALGGGGYNRTNLAKAWCAVAEALATPD